MISVDFSYYFEVYNKTIYFLLNLNRLSM